MENLDVLDSDLASSNELGLNASAKDFLRQTGKWAKLLAITSIIFSLIIIIIGLFFGTIMGAISSLGGQSMPNMYAGSLGVFMAVFYGVIGLVMMYPGIRLLQFSSKTKQALEMNNAEAISEAFRRLRSVFRFYGIIVIIYLALFALMFLSVGIGALR
jgi:hypothetical protein